jgi:integrase
MESTHHWEPWNKGKLVGQKPPLKPKDIWAIRIQLQNAHQVRDLAMFNLAIDSKLRGCDLVNLHVRDITHGNKVLARAMVVQRKTQRPVQFELTEPTRAAVTAWIEKAKLKPEQCLFPSRLAKSPMFQRDSTPGSSISGLPPSDSIRRSMARTQCGGQRPH